jgi:hypothetical protein
VYACLGIADLRVCIADLKEGISIGGYLYCQLKLLLINLFLPQQEQVNSLYLAVHRSSISSWDSLDW